MPSPSEIQDSDGEEGVSPEKLPEVNISPNESFFDGIGSSRGLDGGKDAPEALTPTPRGM